MRQVEGTQSSSFFIFLSSDLEVLLNSGQNPIQAWETIQVGFFCGLLPKVTVTLDAFPYKLG